MRLLQRAARKQLDLRDQLLRLEVDRLRCRRCSGDGGRSGVDLVLQQADVVQADEIGGVALRGLKVIGLKALLCPDNGRGRGIWVSKAILETKGAGAFRHIGARKNETTRR